MTDTLHHPDPQLDLVLERTVDIAPPLLWAAWTRPEHIKHWFTPAPWQTVGCEIDLRPGGLFQSVMRAPNGQEQTHTGCYLEIVENEKLVWTDALGPGYRPAAQPFVTAFITLQAQGAGTRYTALVKHADAATRKKHEEMGFAQGWNTALDQLVAYMKSL
ncbi:MAG: SRPBCC family protein [Pseudomonadota bacterium]